MRRVGCRPVLLYVALCVGFLCWPGRIPDPLATDKEWDARAENLTCTPGLPNSGWCDPPAFDVAVTNALVPTKRGRRGIGLLSHLVNFLACPALALASTLSPLCCVDSNAPRRQRLAHAGQDTAILLSTQLVSVGLNGLFKQELMRQRPVRCSKKQPLHCRAPCPPSTP